MVGGTKAPVSPIRGFVGRDVAIVLFPLPIFEVVALGMPIAEPLGNAEGFLTGEILLCDSAFACCSLLVKPTLTLRFVEGRELILDPGAVVVRVDGLALAGAIFVEPALLSGLDEVEPSLVPGLLPALLFLLIAEAGRRGGPMGLSGGLKKLDRRLSFGVDGMDCSVSIVLSDSEGREVLLRGTWSSASSNDSDSSLKPWREADLKLSREPSLSLTSSSSITAVEREALSARFCRPVLARGGARPDVVEVLAVVGVGFARPVRTAPPGF